MTTDDRAQIAQRAATALATRLQTPRWKPLPHQIPPPGNWAGWALVAGRGAGKTDACASYIDDHINGPPCLSGSVPHWIGIIAPTLGDAATSCFAGPSGIRAHSPGAKLTNGPGGLTVKWPNGSEAKLFGAHTPEDVERLRSGGNRCAVWCEELAAWRHLEAAWNHMRFGLRVGPRPHWIASTTPKPKPLIKRMVAGEERNVVVTTATTYDNPHLEQHIRDALEETYGGTQLGQQELMGLLMDEDENALWTRAMLDTARVRPDDVPELVRTVVGVDPSGGAGEQGIVVAGKSGLIVPPIQVVPEDGDLRPLRPEHHGYVLDDRTCHLPPDGWGRRAVQAAIDWEADELVVERNFGGDMAVATLRTAADALGVQIPIRTVTATRGKQVRAQPVSALTAQGRWHHAGTFSALEDQMCLVAGTKVETSRGHVPIEQVKATDLVMTRDGWAPVQWAGMTGTANQLTGVQLVDCVLWMTPNHEVYEPLQDLFVPARSVQLGQALAVRPSPGSTAIPWRGEAAGGTWKRMGTTGTRKASSFIEPFGKSTRDPYPVASWSTTGMKTLETTSSGISPWSLPRSTGQSTVERLGPSRRTAEPGVLNAGRSGRGSSRLRTPVLSAAPSSGRKQHTLATVSDLARVRLNTAVPVYNLMVADGYLPEFYANGVLVHNCTWYPEIGWSPDRVDSAVWTAWQLKLVRTAAAGRGSLGGDLARKQIAGGRIR